jgi:hypothetical protein
MELINLQIEYFTAISLFFVFQCGADYVKVQQKLPVGMSRYTGKKTNNFASIIT